MFTNERVKLAVLVSGKGSNLKAIIAATEKKGPPAKGFPAQVQVVISDKQHSGGLEMARGKNIPAIFIDPKTFESREAYDQMLMATIKEYNIDLIVLAGFMRVLSPMFVKAFPKQILNIHPSLLPQFPGLHAVKDALLAKVKTTGCTVHYVDEGIDTGPVIMQRMVSVLPEDTEDSLHARIQQEEHILYPEAIEFILCKHLSRKK